MSGEILEAKAALSLEELIYGFRLSSLSEGKSEKTIAIVEAAVRYLEDFLAGDGLNVDVTKIGVDELRGFSVYLRERPRFARHPLTRPQPGRLSGHTINGYMRALQSFWAWLEREGFINNNPFRKLKIPKAPKKVIPTFTEEQLKKIFGVIDTATPTGFRDYTIILTLLDTGMRCGELIGLRLTDVNLENRILKVRGKGNRERLVPIGAKVQKAIWKYVSHHRPEPALPKYDQVFLTRDGRPISKDRLEAIVERYGRKAKITGLRVSPHTFRHTMAVMFLRNGGDVFSLQRILGHSSLEMLRGYVNLAMSDISRAHQKSSPADNLELTLRLNHIIKPTNYLPKKIS
ncbi:MAG: tyrosine-type recombinase/integrase [Dehalococcoidales bacterium]|nr:tyrosine-type recombinase/integrase [Dehalococcoidales bacterium]